MKILLSSLVLSRKTTSLLERPSMREREPGLFSLFWQSSQIDSFSTPLVVPKTRTQRPRSLGVDVFSLFFTEIVGEILRPGYSARVLRDIFAMSKRNSTHVLRRTSTMVPPDRGTCFLRLIFHQDYAMVRRNHRSAVVNIPG